MGALIGALGSQNAGALAQQNGLQNLGAQQLGGYFAPTQAANINQLGGQQYSQAQQQLLGQLQGQANGSGPNLAQQQLQQNTQANIAQQAGLMAGQRGNQNPGAEQYQLGQQAGQINQQAAGQEAMQQGTQQLAAQQALSGLTGQGFGQAAQQAGFNQQTNQFNSQAQQVLAQLLSGNQNAYNQQLSGLYGSQLGAQSSLAGGVLNGLGTLGGLAAKSDERSKVDIAPGSDAVNALLAGISARTYKYKDPDEDGAAPGQRLGVIAQDLERAGPIGKGLVFDTPTGKMINGGQAIGAILAALAEHHRKLKEIEDAAEDRNQPKDD